MNRCFLNSEYTTKVEKTFGVSENSQKIRMFQSRMYEWQILNAQYRRGALDVNLKLIPNSIRDFHYNFHTYTTLKLLNFILEFFFANPYTTKT